MNVENLERLISQALLIKGELDQEAKLMKPKVDMLDGLKVQIEKEFSKLGTKNHTLITGEKAIWVDRLLPGKLNKDLIMERLGVNDLSEYQAPGKLSSFIKLSN